MEIKNQTKKDLKSLLETCITRLGHTEGKRYFSLLISKAENDILNEYERKNDIMLDVGGRFKENEQQKEDKTEIEELPVISEQDDTIPVLEPV